MIFFKGWVARCGRCGTETTGSRTRTDVLLVAREYGWHVSGNGRVVLCRRCYDQNKERDSRETMARLGDYDDKRE